ncbi:hypothetical protein JYK04_08209 [Streptomyces nojiriensis]|nr:hypothetical protein JYK04_00200 [Streptomyces nojiriensis]QTI50332.1 hypothetical protein JYK04_08209 [Streptomyces nojiriensis]
MAQDHAGSASADPADGAATPARRQVIGSVNPGAAARPAAAAGRAGAAAGRAGAAAGRAGAAAGRAACDGDVVPAGGAAHAVAAVAAATSSTRGGASPPGCRGAGAGSLGDRAAQAAPRGAGPSCQAVIAAADFPGASGIRRRQPGRCPERVRPTREFGRRGRQSRVIPRTVRSASRLATTGTGTGGGRPHRQGPGGADLGGAVVRAGVRTGVRGCGARRPGALGVLRARAPCAGRGPGTRNRPEPAGRTRPRLRPAATCAPATS